MAAENVGIIVSIGSAVGALIAVLAFWTRFSDRLTKAQGTADSALQEAAEAKNDVDNAREAIDAMTRDIDSRIERVRREDGEALAAIRQHVTDLAMFVRDNFVRNAEFNAAMSKIEAGQLRLESKLDQLRNK